MLNVGKIEEGFVLDHIKAGKSMSIYHHLQLDKLDCPVAIIKNARSNKMGKKDILKVECDINTLDLDVLFFDGQILETPRLTVPHPDLENRDFVLKPLCDIAPGLVHPVNGKTAYRMLKELEEKTGLSVKTM